VGRRAHCHSSWLGIGGSWVQIWTTFQATLDPWVDTKIQKKFLVRKKRLEDFDSLDAAQKNMVMLNVDPDERRLPLLKCFIFMSTLYQKCVKENLHTNL